MSRLIWDHIDAVQYLIECGGSVFVALDFDGTLAFQRVAEQHQEEVLRRARDLVEPWNDLFDINVGKKIVEIRRV